MVMGIRRGVAFDSRAEVVADFVQSTIERARVLVAWLDHHHSVLRLLLRVHNLRLSLHYNLWLLLYHHLRLVYHGSWLLLHN